MLRAFSMAELMVAVVILGIGLLITTSMFPIAWLKAREVAESTNIATTALTADIYTKSLLRVNGPRSIHPLDKSVSSFFPGDWFSPLPPCSTNPPPCANNEPDNEAAIYPDTRVHLLNTGNYGIGFTTDEDDWLDNSVQVPIADNGWRLEEGLQSFVTDPVTYDWLKASGVHKAAIAPHVRLIPPMEAIPDQVTDPQEFALWAEQFETRRHCWAIFYRMSEMPGPDLVTQADCSGGNNLACNSAISQESSTLGRPRRITMYYVTLKRLGSARFARQRGNEPSSLNLDIAMPRAMPPGDDVLLPVPWRFEATVTPKPPYPPTQADRVQTGIPTEIVVGDQVIVDMIQDGSFLIDDRNGEVFKVAASKNAGNPAQATFVLNKEYRPSDYYDVPDYNPMLDQEANYFKAANYQKTGGMIEVETEPEQRFYWVFPPPVDATDSVRAGGVPLFDGPQPVVGIEVRQLSIAPRLGS